jgi:radical SAM protein
MRRPTRAPNEVTVIEPTVSTIQKESISSAGVRRLHFDVSSRPFLVLVELTRSCSLACRHCRAESAPLRDPNELRTEELEGVLDDLASLGAPRPRVVFSGGDPLRRPDLDDLIRYGARRSLSMAVSPAGTPLASPERLAALREAGAGAVSLSIDGYSPETHDAFRRVGGSFGWTVAAGRSAVAAGLRLQINTTVSNQTVSDLPGIAKLVNDLGAGMWSVFFVVPVGRADVTQALSADNTEDVLHFLHDIATVVTLKTTEAPAYRRVILEGSQKRGRWQPGPLYDKLWSGLDGIWPEGAERARRGSDQSAPSGHRRAPLSVGDGRGVVFVSHTGDVQPSGFLPCVVGNVRKQPLSAIYTQSALLRSMRDPTRLAGRCGGCEYATSCGGSRAQAFARTGDPLGEDKSCPYGAG